MILEVKTQIIYSVIYTCFLLIFTYVISVYQSNKIQLNKHEKII